eukprot:TRINITY_DN1798_c0_g1_i3.p1 TRINITY_DN1798_c0_g1~~TRINITY_DN1798_c0_g1_i3.p1  ORF type:complete len:386 (+),score=55.87 TRINITY_DN1798_c0_g1_i3:82-1239(+)
MGNSPSNLDCLYKCAKNNDTQKLQNKLRQFQNVDSASRQAYLEWKDHEGRTALIVAARGGSHQIVEELIRWGSNVHYVAPTAKGGSALHEATLGGHRPVINSLLRVGASPFVENVRGVTAMDYAIDTRNADTLRLFEAQGVFWGWITVKSRKLLGSKWKLRWITIIPRFNFPSASAQQNSVKLQLNCFADQQQYEPKFRFFLQGAEAHVIRDHAETQVQLQLGRVQSNPAGVVCRGDSRSGMVIFFKAYDASPQSIQYIEEFALAINQQYSTQNQTASQQLPRSESLDAALEAVARNESMASQLNQRSNSLQPEEQPSAPPQTDSIVNEEDVCIVCLTNPKQAGFAHGDTVHKCVCESCILSFSVGTPCPMCRQSIEVLLRKFYE